jgi:hypothetical protein
MPPVLKRIGSYAAALAILAYAAWLAVYAVAKWPWT